jgi:hypothetical protein
VRFDGSIDAAYFNPEPIRVAKTRVNTQPGQIIVFVELQDIGYPGSYYTLVYDSDTDRLVGVYHHMVLKKNFNIYFMREKILR